MVNLEPDLKTLNGWLKGKFRSALKEYFKDELTELWNEFVGDSSELFKQQNPGLLPGRDMGAEISSRKDDVEKVLAFKPIADDFISQQETAVEEYTHAYGEYLRSLLTDKIGSGLGTSRAELVKLLSQEISSGDDPPALLVAIYVIKNAGRFRGTDD